MIGRIHDVAHRGTLPRGLFGIDRTAATVAAAACASAKAAAYPASTTAATSSTTAATVVPTIAAGTAVAVLSRSIHGLAQLFVERPRTGDPVGRFVLRMKADTARTDTHQGSQHDARRRHESWQWTHGRSLRQGTVLRLSHRR